MKEHRNLIRHPILTAAWFIPATLECEKTHLGRPRACRFAARVFCGTIRNPCRGPSVRSHFPWPSHSHHSSSTRSAWHSPAASVRRAEWCSIRSLRDGSAVEVDRRHLELYYRYKDHTATAGGKREIDRRSDFERPASKDRSRRTRRDGGYATTDSQRRFRAALPVFGHG